MDRACGFRERPELDPDGVEGQETRLSAHSLSGEREGFMGYVVLIAIVVIIVRGFIASMIYYQKKA